MSYVYEAETNNEICIFSPKGTAVCAEISTVHFDPLQWETPEEFNPGHFLDEKGNFRNRAAFMPFSAGDSIDLDSHIVGLGPAAGMWAAGLQEVIVLPGDK